MTDELTTPAAPAATPVTPPALAATPEPLAGDGTETISLEDARKLRSEAFNLRKRMKVYEDAEEAKRLAALDDVERSKAEIVKADKRATEAEAKIKDYQQKLVTAQVKLAAQTKGIVDPDLAALALSSKNQAWTLEYDDDGMPSNLDQALDTLVKNKPIFKPNAAEPATIPPASPAQAAPAPAPAIATPALPAMNPGRTSIAQPGTRPAGGRPPRLTDTGIFSAPGSIRQDRA